MEAPHAYVHDAGRHHLLPTPVGVCALCRIVHSKRISCGLGCTSVAWQPALQRHIIRVLWMVPIYSIDACLSLTMPTRFEAYAPNPKPHQQPVQCHPTPVNAFFQRSDALTLSASYWSALDGSREISGGSQGLCAGTRKRCASCTR